MVVLTELESQMFPANNGKVIEEMEKTLLEPPVSDKDNQLARERNIQTFINCDSKITVVLGGTGTGKTTGFMLQAMREGGKNILIVPTNSAVIDAEKSITGLLNPEIEYPTSIVTYTEASRGWIRSLMTNVNGKREFIDNVLVICNASFFVSTFDHWFDNDFDIMLDEPDDRTNLTVSISLILCIHRLRQKQIQYRIPRYHIIEGETREFSNRVYYYTLQEMYLSNGNSYSFDPEEDENFNQMDDENKVRELIKHSNILKSRMSRYEGRFFTSSATFPQWGIRAFELAGLKFETIQMRKPENPSFEIYMSHFDEASRECIEKGNMDALLPQLQNLAMDYAGHLRGFLPKFLKNLPEDERAIQEKSARKILVGLPGNFEVSELRKSLVRRAKKLGIIVIAGYQRDDERIIIQIATAHDPIIIEIVPSHELRGLNHEAQCIMINQFGRISETHGNQTILTVKLNSWDEIKQAMGRAGRRGPRVIFFLGSEKMFDELAKETPFDPQNLKSTLLMCISHDLNCKELALMNDLFEGATSHDLISRMDELLEDGLVVVNDDGQYKLTRKGRLSNVFHDDLEWFVDIEKYLNDNKNMSHMTLFKMLLWRQISLGLTARSPLFKFVVPPDMHGAKIPDLMMMARDVIGNNEPVYSHFDLIWKIVNKIMDIIPPNRFNELKLTDTFFYEELGMFVKKAFLNPSALRNACHTALEQMKDLERRMLIDKLPFNVPAKFGFDDFTRHKTLQGLATGEYQIAFRITDEYYIGADGFIYLVEKYLIDDDTDRDCVIIVHSLVKPNMLDEKMALATSILPTSAFADVDLIGVSLVRDHGVDERDARSINDWIMSLKTDEPLECPFTMDALGWFECLGAYELDDYTISLLKAIKNMQDMRATLTPERLKHMDNIFERFSLEVHHQMNAGAFIELDDELPTVKIDIGGYQYTPNFVSPDKKKFQPDTNPETAFIPYVAIVSKKSKRDFSVPDLQLVRFDEKKHDFVCTAFQKLHCKNVRNPKCPYCKESTIGNISLLAVQQPSANPEIVNIDNMIVLPCHTDCVHKSKTFRRCAKTGGYRYRTEFVNLALDVDEQPASSAPADDEDVTLVCLMITNLDNINSICDKSYEVADVRTMSPDERRSIYLDYMKRKKEQIDAERNKAQKFQFVQEQRKKKERERHEKELRRRDKTVYGKSRK